MKRYIVIQEKLCFETGRFKTFVFSKDIPAFSPQDHDRLNDFECGGEEQAFRYIKIDLETGNVTVMRSNARDFPRGFQLFTHDDDKNEETKLIDSDA